MKVTINPIMFALFLFMIEACVETPITPPEEPEDMTPVLDEFLFHGVKAGKEIKLQGKYLDRLTWTSESPFTAIASGAKLFTKHIGSTRIISSGNEFVLWVLVEPIYTDYDLPWICNQSGVTALDYSWPSEGDLLWGCSAASIKMNEKAHTLDKRSTKTLQVYNTGNVRSPYVCYFFENDKLTQAASIIDPRYITNLPAFLEERYDIKSIDLNTYTAYFERRRGSKDEIFYVGGMSYSSDLGGILLAFLPYSGTKAVRDIEQQLQEITVSIQTVLGNL